MLENDQLGNGNWLLTHLFLKYLVVGWENISHCTSWIVVKGNLKGNIFIEEGGFEHVSQHETSTQTCQSSWCVYLRLIKPISWNLEWL